MKKHIALFCLVLISLASNNSLRAQIKTSERAGQVNTITTAVPFLIIAPDSRSGGMGEVGVATSPDANSIHWNPAKLAFIDKSFGASLSYTPWLRALVPDINLAYLSGYKRISKRQVIGMSLLYFSLGNITFTDEQGNSQGDHNPNEYAIDLSYAQSFSDNFSGGVALRYIRSDLTNGVPSQGELTRPANAVAADISVYYKHPMEISSKNALLTFGTNISNIGNKVSYTASGIRDFIPTNLKLGSGLTTDFDKYNSLTVSVDLNKLLVPTPDSITHNSDIPVARGIFRSFSDAPGGFKEEMAEIIYSLGLEYWYDKQFAIRAGYFHESATKGNRQFVTLGAGLKYNVFGLDFAYVIPTTSTQRSPLENTLRFSLLFDFDAGKANRQTGE